MIQRTEGHRATVWAKVMSDGTLVHGECHWRRLVVRREGDMAGGDAGSMMQDVMDLRVRITWTLGCYR